MRASNDENRRLQALHNLQILDTSRNAAFDCLTEVVARHFDLPIAAVSLMDEHRQWFKSEFGLGCSETPRSVAFCSYTIAENSLLIIEDAQNDVRTSKNPLVTQAPGLRFYAGVPIGLEPDLPLGTLCIADTKCRKLSATHAADLMRFAVLAEELLRQHYTGLMARAQAQEAQALSEILTQRTAELEKQKRLFDLSSKQAKLGAFEYDLATGECELSDECRRIMGLPPTGAMTLDAIFARVDFPQWYIDLLKEVDIRGLDYCIEVPITTPDGSSKWISEQGKILHTGVGRSRRFGIAMDVTEAKQREQNFELLFDKNPVPMWVIETETYTFLAANEAALRHYGYTREQFLAMTLYDLRPPTEHERLQERLKNHSSSPQSGEDWLHLKADGTLINVLIYSNRVMHMNRPCILTAAIDVTEQRRQEAVISHMAHHDHLTGLPNRRMLDEWLQNELLHRSGNETPLGVMVVDCDGFKSVNDTFGHAAGDELLKDIAGRLQANLNCHGIIARIGGDEFAVIASGVSDKAFLRDLATRLVGSLQDGFFCKGQSVSIGCSVGISVAPEEGTSADVLLRNADLALYKAKSSGRNTFCFFEPSMLLAHVARRGLEQDLSLALRQHQFELHYQPIVNLQSEAVLGYEALLRWNHPDRGRVPPGEFISIAEESGLICPISEWVVHEACRQASLWPTNLRVAVNTSAAQFAAGTILSVVQKAIEDTGLLASRLELEITETLLLEGTDKNIAQLHELKALGIGVSLDDFGTGYSSLSYLQNLPVDRLKIDRTFVSRIGTGKNSIEILRAAITLGQSLGLATLAEGIETSEQARCLRELGCAEGQGYLFGKPTKLLVGSAEAEKHHGTYGGAQ